MIDRVELLGGIPNRTLAGAPSSHAGKTSNLVTKSLSIAFKSSQPESRTTNVKGRGKKGSAKAAKV